MDEWNELRAAIKGVTGEDERGMDAIMSAISAYKESLAVEVDAEIVPNEEQYSDTRVHNEAMQRAAQIIRGETRTTK